MNFFSNNSKEKTIIKKIPINLSELKIVKKNTAIENQNKIYCDFDIERVTDKSGKYFDKNNQPYKLAKLKDIAEKLGINKNKNKPFLIKSIQDKFYSSK